jgi:L-threonylcarbamoyladenylate synthase
VEGNVCSILRPGKITIDDIKQALPGVFEFKKADTKKIVAPGLLKSHYSPKKPLYFLKNESVIPANSGIILHSLKTTGVGASKIIHTSLSGNFLEVASNLFSAMHSMEDDKDIKQIFIEPVIEEGLGIAIMDRLKKAAFRYTGE